MLMQWRIYSQTALVIFSIWKGKKMKHPYFMHVLLKFYQKNFIILSSMSEKLLCENLMILMTFLMKHVYHCAKPGI